MSSFTQTLCGVEYDLLAVVVGDGRDCHFLRVKGRNTTALLKSQTVFDSFGVHELRFGDIVVVDIEHLASGDRVTALRMATDEEYEAR